MNKNVSGSMPNKSKKPLKEVKICCIGSSGAGKTCLMRRYVEEKFDNFVSPTVGSGFFSKSLSFKDHDLRLNIWDTAGQETFKSLTRHYYRGASVIIIVYDITDDLQFDESKLWVAEIRQCTKENLILGLVGNKIDIEEDRKVTFEDGKTYAHSIGAIFVETSAKTGYHVDLLFKEIIAKLPDDMKEFKKPSGNVNLCSSSVNDSNKKPCCY